MCIYLGLSCEVRGTVLGGGDDASCRVSHGPIPCCLKVLRCRSILFYFSYFFHGASAVRSPHDSRLLLWGRRRVSSLALICFRVKLCFTSLVLAALLLTALLLTALLLTVLLHSSISQFCFTAVLHSSVSHSSVSHSSASQVHGRIRRQPPVIRFNLANTHARAHGRSRRTVLSLFCFEPPSVCLSVCPSVCLSCLCLQVKGCTTLIPPIEVLLLSDNSVREVCAAVWVGCFTANPPEVAFDLLCRLMRCE